KVVGLVPGGLPAFGLPRFSVADLDQLLPLALACFLLSYIESVAAARTFALKYGYPMDPDQELLALGAANLAVGLGQGFPVGGGMSQSAVNDQGGARSSLALVVVSIILGLVLLFLTGLFRNLPQPVLAAVVLMAVKGLFDLQELRHLFRVSKQEF